MFFTPKLRVFILKIQTKVLHDFQLRVLLLKLFFFVLFVVILFLIYSLALSIQTFFIFLLFIIDVTLKAFMHLKGRIKPVFDGVVGPAMHITGNQRPLLAILQEEAHQLLVFFEGPLFFGDGRVQVVVPSLTALLAYSTGQSGSDVVPSFGAVLQHHALEKIILLVGPCSFGATLDLILLLQAKIFEIRLIRKVFRGVK